MTTRREFIVLCSGLPPLLPTQVLGQFEGVAAPVAAGGNEGLSLSIQLNLDRRNDQNVPDATIGVDIDCYRAGYLDFCDGREGQATGSMVRADAATTSTRPNSPFNHILASSEHFELDAGVQGLVKRANELVGYVSTTMTLQDKLLVPGFYAAAVARGGMSLAALGRISGSVGHVFSARSAIAHYDRGASPVYAVYLGFVREPYVDPVVYAYRTASDLASAQASELLASMDRGIRQWYGSGYGSAFGAGYGY